MNYDDEAELNEARAMLEKYKDRMITHHACDNGSSEVDEALDDQVMLLGPKTELSLRRILRDIKESGSKP